jgi:CelD/BcsL family acetyltransferase involved in cellulose biosynthesis
MIEGELITDIAALEALVPEWDSLAVAASNPVTGPAWVLAWWHHLGSPGLRPRVVAVRDGRELIGLAPFYACPGRRGVVEYRLMGGDFGMCMEPLARVGREWDVAREIGQSLARASPPPNMVAFGPMTLASHWIEALRSQWPGPMLGVVRRQRVDGAPVIVLHEPSFDAWFASFSPKIRRDLRRSERLFEEAGGTSRWSTAETFRADAEAFSNLHKSRWDSRGWSRLSDLGDNLTDWLHQLGGEPFEQDRLRMCVLEVAGSPICVNFSLVAGGEFATVNSGWDERYARLAPAKIAVLRLMLDAYRLECRRVHLGAGNLANKLRLANGNDPIARTVFLPPSSRLPQTYGTLLPGFARTRARDVAARALPPDSFEAAKKLFYRLPISRG